MLAGCLTFCLAEDRIAEEVGLRLALLSIFEHCPAATVYVFRPEPTEEFSRWLQDFSGVRLISRRPVDAETWNCKPQALLDLLELGCREAIWLDSDIMLARSCSSLFEKQDERTIVLAEEMATTPHQGSATRTEKWGLPAGRAFPITMNSCVVRVTQQHRPFLVRWKEMLANPEYLAAQKLPMAERPFCFSGDQDAFSALLGSRDFNEVPVHFLKRGTDLIHSGGARTYSLWERLTGLGRQIPPIIHSPGPKPWIAFGPGRDLPGLFWTVQRLLLDVSPYMAIARRYRASLGAEGRWADYTTPVGRILRFSGFGHFALRGLPLTLVFTVVAFARRLVARFRPSR